MKKLTRLLWFVLIVVSVNAQESFEQMVRHFAYDKTASLDLQEVKVEDQNGVKVHDISYASPKGGRVAAYLIIPRGKGPFPAVIFGHWSMKGSPYRNRTEFFEEALIFAKGGAASLLIESADIRPGVTDDPDPISEKKADLLLQQVLDIRRGIDVLLARNDIDPNRLAYVGHSFNAGAGALLSGFEKRFKAYVLMAGGNSDVEVVNSGEPSVVQWIKSTGEDRVRQYLRDYAWLDAGNFVGHAAPSAVLLQYALNDGILTEKRERYFFSLVSEPKELKLYEAKHALNAAARWDRFEWLRGQLRLKPIPRDVVDAVPQIK